MRISNISRGQQIENELESSEDNFGDIQIKRPGQDEMIETMSVENLNRANFDIDVGGNDNMASLRYKLDSEVDPTSRSSNIMFADVHSDSDGVLFKNMSENVINQESVEMKTNEFLNNQKNYRRKHPEDQLEHIKSALIDLYLSVKITTNEEIAVYDITVEDNHNFFANDILVHNCTEIFQNTAPSEYNVKVMLEDGSERLYDEETEYQVDAIYEPISVATARWCTCDDERTLDQFKKKSGDYLALDGGNNLTYIAPTMVNLSLAQERNPEIEFHSTREH